MPAVPPIPGLPRYTTWAAVPEELYTRTQLGRLTPPRKPGGPPVAQALYYGNCYAPLYPLDTSVPKRPCTPAQKAALDRARALQCVCRRCGREAEEPLGQGRWCARCAPVVSMWGDHHRAQRGARELLGDRSAVLLVVAAGRHALRYDGMADEPVSVAVVRLHDAAVLYAGAAGADGSAERVAVVAELDAVLPGHRLQHETMRGPISRYPGRLLVDTPAGFISVTPERQTAHSWIHRTRDTPAAEDLWRHWYAWQRWSRSGIADLPDELEADWPRSDDAAADGRGLIAVMHRIADGTAPVCPDAPWLADGHGEPDLSRSRRGAR